MKGLKTDERKILAELLKSASSSLENTREELNHALNVLEWIHILDRRASSETRLSGLLHDCERFFESKRINIRDYSSYNKYKQAHAKNSAKIASTILKKVGVDKKAISSIKEMIEDHEEGSKEISKTLLIADSLSFFSVNILSYFENHGAKTTRKKISFMYNRLPNLGKKLLASTELDFKKNPSLKKMFSEVEAENGHRTLPIELF